MMNRPLPMRSGRSLWHRRMGFRCLRKMGKRNPRIHRFPGNRQLPRDNCHISRTRDIHTLHRRDCIRHIPRNLHMRGILRTPRNRQRGFRISQKVCPTGILRIGK